MYTKKNHIHFVGIGGIGMSGIATVLQQQGYQISGCDKDIDQQSVKNLRKLGCSIFEGNNTASCHDPSIRVLVYSSAIQKEMPEILRARSQGIPTIPRAQMLAELMRTKYSIAISGSHGKTTTTSLVSHVLLEAGLDPTIIIGGHLKNIATNARLGHGDFLIAEADESDRSLSLLHATIGLVTNISLEHLETYRDLDDIIHTFKLFLGNLPFYGSAIICLDDPQAKQLLSSIPNRRCITYGLSPEAHIRATEVKLYPGYSTYTLFLQKGSLSAHVVLPMPGEHNVLNSLGALAVTQELDIPLDIAINALETFTGVDRRFTFRGVSPEGIEVFDDYGHHPVEIKKTVLVARNRTKKKVVMAFQPHRFTRTKALWNDFIKTLSSNEIDHLILTDIYPASEHPIENITAEQMVKDILKENSTCSVEYVPFDKEFKHLKKAILESAGANDLLLLQGAGDLYKITSKLL